MPIRLPSTRKRGDDAGDSRALAPQAMNPAEHVLALQRTLGNHGVTTLLARDKTKKKKAPPKPVDVDFDEKAGTINSAAGEPAGFKAPDGTWYATVGGAAPAQARMGDLEASGSKIPILKMKKATLRTDATGAESMLQDGAQVGAVLGATPAVILTGKGAAAYSGLPAQLKALLPANARISLDDGRHWVTMDFPDGSGLNWVEAKHSKKTWQQRRKGLEDVVNTLPKSLQDKLGPELDVMGFISMLEGTFGSRSPTKWQPVCKHEGHGGTPWKGKATYKKADAEAQADKHEEEAAKKEDPKTKKPEDHDVELVQAKGTDAAASLGIHQWAMAKNTAAGEGSLVTFFRTLHKRATAAEAKKPDDRSDEDSVYVEAWKQASSAGLSFSGNTMKLNGKEPTGMEMEEALDSAMATGSLRTYQMLALSEELDDKLWKQRVVPGMWGSQMMGNKYRSDSPSKEAEFPSDKYTIKLAAPESVATVDDVCTDAKLRVAVVNIYPNRPGWIGPLVWRATIDGDPAALGGALISKIVAAQDAATAAPPAGPATPAPAPAPAKGRGKGKKPATPAKPVITLENAADKKAMQDLQALVWPSGKGVDQNKVLAGFYAATLQFYKGEDEKTLPGKDWKQHKKKTPKKRKLTFDWRSRSERLAATENLF